jgi:hypothetical protein
MEIEVEVSKNEQAEYFFQKKRRKDPKMFNPEKTYYLEYYPNFNENPDIYCIIPPLSSFDYQVNYIIFANPRPEC